MENTHLCVLSLSFLYYSFSCCFDKRQVREEKGLGVCLFFRSSLVFAFAFAFAFVAGGSKGIESIMMGKTWQQEPKAERPHLIYTQEKDRTEHGVKL